MASVARKFESESFMPEKSVIEERVDNLKESVSDLKVEVVQLKAEVRQVGDSLTEHRLETKDSLARQRDEMKEYFDKHANDRTAMIRWMTGTMIGAAGLAFIAAKFFSHP